jgi:hypothetical protein
MRRTSALTSFPVFQTWTDFLLAWLDRRPADMLDRMAGLRSVKILDDPEANFLQGWLLCDAGDAAAGLVQIGRAVGKGYFPALNLARSRHFDPLRSTPGFQALQAKADAGREQALAAFREAGGTRLLGR